MNPADLSLRTPKAEPEMRPNYNPRLAPKAHQVEAVDAMMIGNVANYDDQGLGKTKQAYDLAGKLFESDAIDLMIVICKASLKDNFYYEATKDADQLVTQVAAGGKSERKRLYKFPSYHILIVSYENAIADNDQLCVLMQNRRTLLCLDEAHYIKNPDALRTKACLVLSRLAVKAILFTGTPIPNGIADIYTQLEFLGHAAGEGGMAAKFKDVGAFKSFLMDNMIRRRKENLPELNLPKKEVINVEVDLSADERIIYERAVSDFLVQFENRNGSAIELTIDGILPQLVRLNQLASNPALLLSNYDGKSAKISKLDELVKATIDKNEKVIIWTSYRQNIKALLARYCDFGAVAIYGDISKDDIQTNVVKFRTCLSTKILLAIPACAREGFTLTAASKAIYLDRSFSLLDWVQSQDRIHRISQTKDCEIMVLVAKGTIDERIDEILERKDRLQRFLLGDAQDYNGLESLSLVDLRRMLGR